MKPAAADRRNPLQTSSSLDVFMLGTVDFDSSLELQERLRAEVVGRTDAHGVMLVCEHPPAVTIGREGSFADVLVDREELVSRRMDVRWLNRGGGAFAHSPGQLAVYIIVPLDRISPQTTAVSLVETPNADAEDVPAPFLGPGLLAFRTAIENGLIGLAADLKVPAERSSLVPGAICRCGQFAFIGTAIRDWVSYGGVYINVSLPQEVLDLVRWTDSDVRITSLAAQRTRPTAMSTVRESAVRNIASSLGYGGYHLYTGHPLLHRSSRKIYVYA